MLARHSSDDLRRSWHARIDTVPARPSRRLVLTGALALTTGALTGCGVRLEDDAPDIPFVPTREPIPGETALLAMLGTLESADGEHATARADRLRAALAESGVPERVLDAAQAPDTDAETAAACEAAVRECGPGLLRLVGQLTATLRITDPIGARARLWTPSGDSAWQAGDVAADALEATRATSYALAVVAGRLADGTSRTRTLTTLRELRQLEVRQTTAAGDDVGSVTLGYERPDDLSGSAGTDWVTESFVRLQAAYAAGLTRLGDDRDAALETTQWMVAAERVSRTQFPQPSPELYGDGAQPL